MPRSKHETKRLERCAELAAGRGYRLAYSLVGSRHDAEELVSQALTIATSKAAAIPRQVWPWFAKTITFEARNLRRKAARRGPNEELREVEAKSKSGLEVAIEREMNQRLWQAIQNLSESERETLALVHLAGLSRREAARQRGISATSLRRELEGALAKLRAELGVSDKVLLAAIPFLIATPSAAFVATLGTTSGASASAASLGAGGVIAGGIAVKKIAASIALLLLLLFGGWYGISQWDSGGRNSEPIGDTLTASEPSPKGEHKNLPSKSDKKREGKDIGAEDQAALAQVTKEEALVVKEETIETEPVNPLEQGIPENVMRYQIVDKNGNPRPNAYIYRELGLGPFGRMVRQKRWLADQNGVVDVLLSDADLKTNLALYAYDSDTPSLIVTFRHTARAKGQAFEVITLHSYSGMSGHEPFFLDVYCKDKAGNPIAGLYVEALLTHNPRQQLGKGSICDSDGYARVRAVNLSGKVNRITLAVLHPSSKSSRNAPRHRLLVKELEQSEFSRRIELTIDSLFAVKGRVVRQDGSAASEGQIIVKHTRLMSVNGMETATTSWRARAELSGTGEFYLPCATLDEIRIDAYWHDPVTGAEERASTGAFHPDTKGIADVGEIRLDKIYHFKIKALWDSEPLADAKIQIRREEKARETKFTTDISGEAQINTLIQSDLSSESGASIEMRVAHEKGVSDWFPVRQAALISNTIVAEVKAVAQGTLKISYFGAAPDSDEVSLRANLLDGPLGSFQASIPAGEGDEIQLPIGEYRLQFELEDGLLARNYKVDLGAGEVRALRVEVVKTGVLKVYQSPGITKHLVSIHAIPQGKPEWLEDAAPYEGFNHYLWPNHPFGLQVSIFTKDRLAMRTKEILPMSAGEERVLWINDLVKELAAEIDGD